MKKVKGLTLVLGGEAGQGIQFIEKTLLKIVKSSGFYVFATKEYMSRIRGGINTTEIRISSEPVRAHVEQIDILVPLKNGVVDHLGPRVSSKTTIVGKKEFVGENGIELDFEGIATEFGNRLYSNTVALGFLCGLIGLSIDLLNEQIKKTFADKKEEVVSQNIQAAEDGKKRGEQAAKEVEGLTTKLIGNEVLVDTLLMNGADAVALGALAGGCDSAFAYPMTPGTSVFLNLAEFSRSAEIVVEQVEDEIAAINMAIGAWYAGGRALVSTAGGGFALMTEGISLAGMTETPVVVHVAGRPGPATGLPTRTEQGDLNLVLYAGHGEFARLILAPGTIEQAFEYSRLAFNLADKYQIPVFILTDQFFVDSYYNIEHPGDNQVHIEQAIVETDNNYKRYTITDSGISPRGVPGYGKGRVCLDSDEHDEDGKITEDLAGVHMAMAKKRMDKLNTLKDAAIEPELIGSKSYKTLLVGWGSTYTVISEALEMIEGDDISFLFCPQLYPFSKKLIEYIDAAEKVIVVENNQTGQFADLIQKETGILVPERILKYDGMPFSVEELVVEITKRK